ncbi:MAG: aminoglycoside phosphotransferase family protein [Phycisphaerae bacterium]
MGFILGAISRCLAGHVVRDELNRCIDWPGGVQAEEVLVRRFTPRPQGRFDIEYAVRLGATKSRFTQMQKPMDSNPWDPSVVTLYGRYPMLDVETHGFESWPLKPTDSNPWASPVSGVYVDIPTLNVTIHSMDQDPAFPQVGRCLDAGEMASRIGDLLSRESRNVTGPSAESLCCEPVSFRRGRRFVVRYVESNGPGPHRAWAGKCYANNRGKKLAERHRHLADHLASFGDGSVRVPRMLGYEPDLRMAVTEWSDVSAAGGFEPSDMLLAQRSARVLAALQSCPVLQLKDANSQGYWNTLKRWCELIGALRPALADQAGELLQQLADARRRFEPSRAVVTHGDFYESQIVIGKDATTILDLDTLAAGDRCADVGNCLAHLWLWCLEHDHGFEYYTSLARAMLQEYESATEPVDESALAYYWAATLFRAGALHAFRDRTAPYAAPLWAMVVPVLNKGRKALEPSRSDAPRLAQSQRAAITVVHTQRIHTNDAI